MNNLFTNPNGIKDLQDLFLELFFAKDEDELDAVISKYPDFFTDDKWKPLGDNPSNYGVVKNQQSNAIAALIEKVTNSIDAILTKKCLESGINPESDEAPESMEQALETFYPDNNWDLKTQRKEQAKEIQIIADGKGPKSKKNNYPTSVIVYDNGEGQHPENFENSFLSLLRGNKNKVKFVQGKYNMGGSGAIVFCGKKRYQLIASKRYDNSGDFGFTLIREHPKRESDQAKETWYEYLLIDNKIASFKIDKLDIGLHERKFTTGTLIKMYSYQFPKGYSGFAQDLNQSINEFLFFPALPILTKDTVLRYPNNKVLDNDLYGLKRRLNNEEQEYLDDKFSEEFDDEKFGKMKVSCFVFKTKVKGNDLKKSKEVIRKRYFKNNMAVLFSLNGQVHGHYTSEFITRSLKLNLLKNNLLIHVDCTELSYNFRKELFMASRDRLKEGEETQFLRSYLSNQLSKKDGRLAQIEKFRKQAVDIDTSSDTKDLLKSFTKNLPFDSDLHKLLSDTFKLDIKKKEGKKPESKKNTSNQQEEIPFNPQRYPSQFKLDGKNNGETEVAKIPLEGDKTIKFSTDVENDYFDRSEDPGEMTISILNIKKNETKGGDAPGEPKDPTQLFNIVKSSPNKGTIKLSLNPKDEMKVGDMVQMKVSLSSPGAEFDEIFWVKIADKEKPKVKAPKEEDENENLGLPELKFMYQNPPEEEGIATAVSWEAVEVATNIEANYDTVMIPEAEGDTLVRIFVNMDSRVLKAFKSKYKNPNQEQLQISNRKYFTSVYFHTLFLYTITKNRGYQIYQMTKDKDEPEYVELGQYLKDIFDNYYSTFILNFGGMEEMMMGLGD
ncbi:hypothetical protein [Leeuwenhoekiella sp. NPDC079379]|uniref:hypothetical protein n=1 Tax=Leeuwenhoekiella sp. NPDC079379 TaxID=3364122 RepID=UPI0037CB2FE7